MQTLKDIATIPEVKLVIELDDADKDSEGITSTFILTREVEEGLHTILSSIDKHKGCGIFIKGNFGSGKSHFLSYLYLLLKKRDLPVVKKYKSLKNKEIKALKISLVKYPSSQGLEKIVLSEAGYKGDVVNRDDIFKEIVDCPVVIIIDELSEFLRSKPDKASFYEDIRFLQFIGEFSFTNPLWIVASLQEWIEETGHISSSIFNRIKDRFPLRINLSSAHIEDIIDERIVLKKRGAEEVMKEVFSDLKTHYAHLPLKYEEFRKTYPLHPFTVRFLSGLTQVFSQHRGVIQFVFNETNKKLEEPVDSLITPESIFDHFEDRIREIPEFSSLVRVVYDYYKRHIEEIITKPTQRDLCLSTVKILILTEVSPFEKRKSSKDIAEILLKKISTITSDINYEFIRDAILMPLVSHQMYIKSEGDSYFIDPNVDEGIKVKAGIKKMREKLEDRNVLFSEICKILDLSYLPMDTIMEGKKYSFLWQNSLRECVVLTAYPDQIKRDEIERMIRGMERNLDGFFIILSPFFETKEWIFSLKERYASSFLSSMIFWSPRRPTGKEILFLEEFIARNMLSHTYPDLGSEIRKDEIEFREIMTTLYFEGEIIYGMGNVEDNLSDIGYLPIQKLLAQLFDISLKALHPNHVKIMPKVDFFSSQHLHSMFRYFIKQGRISTEEAEQKGLMPYIKGLIEPMGVIKKSYHTIMVFIDAGNELVSHLLNIAASEEKITNIKHTLKKGKWGMGEEQINLLLSIFIVTGYLVPYREEELMDLNDISQLRSGEITTIKIGKTISQDLLGYIKHGEFIWGEVEETPTPLTQKGMWKEAVKTIKRGRDFVSDISKFSENHRTSPVFKKLQVNYSIINRLVMFFDSITFSLSPAEGVEKVLAYIKGNREMAYDISYIEKLHSFLSEHFQDFGKFYLYMTHTSLRLPEELGNTRDSLVKRMENFLDTMDDEFTELKEEWDVFFERFSAFYREEHNLYYHSPLFEIKKDVMSAPEIKILKSITSHAPTVTFECDWIEIKRELDKLPARCGNDINYELFLKPLCSCGFKPGDEAPICQTDFKALCKTGIDAFLKSLQSSDNRDKLLSYAHTLRDTDRSDISEKIFSLLELTIEEANIQLLPVLLTEEALNEIENALKGSWKIKEVKIEEFVERITERRFRFDELKELFFKWIGGDSESIIWIRDRNLGGIVFLREELARYGSQGERVYRELGGTDFVSEPGDINEDYLEEIEERLKEEGKLRAFEAIKWSSFSMEELFAHLEKEKLKYLKKRLREEIFHRLRGKMIDRERIVNVHDETMRDVLSLLRLIAEEGAYSGVEVFTKIIAPAGYFMERIKFSLSTDETISGQVISLMEDEFSNIVNSFEKDSEKFTKAKELDEIREWLSGVVIILDGLRYDLWIMIKEELEREGFRIKDRPYIIPAPSVTSNFRKILGIEGEGFINGRSYTSLTWAEKGITKREIKNFLYGTEELRFLHFNFIDVKMHASSIDIYPLYLIILEEFKKSILSILKNLPSFQIISDHGFRDTGKLKERYVHGGGTMWEVILPAAEVIR